MAQRSPTAILLLSCPDRRGLVARVSDFIYRHHGNITDSDQHTDLERGVFLQRIEWELGGFGVARGDIREAFRPIAEEFAMRWTLRFSDELPRTAVFVSKQEHCLYDLLVRKRMNELEAEIALIVSNHPDLEEVARSFGVPFACFPLTKETRAVEEPRIIAALEARGIELIVLARYMQILGPALISRWPEAIINIHHSFLPAFAGARPYHQAYERGVKIIGATAHYVTEQLDEGPIIEQDVARVSHRDAVGDLVRKGKDLEKVVLARAVGLHLRSRVIVYDHKTVVFD